MRFALYLPLCLVLLLFSACKDKSNPINGDKPCCPPILPGIVPTPPYDSPIWHPSGQFIGFNHVPLRRIERPYGECCPYGVQYFDSDSIGFWLISPDGINKRRIFPYRLHTPAWSPDGNWIAFVAGVQIFKMRFTGTTFDTTSIVQLTTEGRNFFPGWSPDGQWIAYDNTVCGNAFEPPPPNSCGILVMRADGSQKRFIARGRMPTWTPDGTYLIYIGLWAEIYRVNVGDTSQVTRLTSFNQINPYSRDNRHPKYSADGTKIAFWSSPIGNVWLMNSDGTNPRQLTHSGVEATGLPFGWSPAGDKIVYTRYQSTDWTMKNGVLWLLDVNSATETQLTFNP